MDMICEELWEKYLDAREEEYRQELIIQYLPLVKQIARRMSLGLPGHIDIDDMISWGILGLLDALDKYRPEKGCQFKSYASLRIKGAILDELRRLSWLPRSLIHNIKKVEEAYRQVENRMGREATPEEVAEEMGVSSTFVDKVLAQTNHVSVLSLESLLFSGDDEQGRALIDTLPTSEAGPEKTLEKKEHMKVLKQGLEKLPEKEKLVLSLYYYEELTMKEIGSVLDLSESRVSQIHSRAIMRLRKYLEKND